MQFIYLIINEKLTNLAKYSPSFKDFWIFCASETVFSWVKRKLNFFCYDFGFTCLFSDE